MKISDYAPGTPCWVDLGSPDVEVSAAFYTTLFGWTAQDPDPAAGGYTIFHQGDAPVAGIGPLMTETAVPAWSWYASTDDAQATACRVEGAGGQVLLEPMDILDAGRMAAFLDNTGTPFSVWQAKEFKGAALINEPGTFVWNELMTRNTDAASDFYGKVLGWHAKPSEQPGMTYVEFQMSGRSIAGMMPMAGEQWPVDLPNHWMVYFAVADTDAAAEQVVQLGGSIPVPPTDSPAGRFAVAGDPTGAPFAFVALA